MRTNWVVNSETDQIVGPCGCSMPNTALGRKQARNHVHTEPVLLMVDVAVQTDEGGMLPLAAVMEDIRQALAPRSDVEVTLAHVSIREHRDEMLNCFNAINDEEARRG